MSNFIQIPGYKQKVKTFQVEKLQEIVDKKLKLKLQSYLTYIHYIQCV